MSTEDHVALKNLNFSLSLLKKIGISMVTASTEHDFLAGRRGANSPRGIGVASLGLSTTILDFRATFRFVIQ